MIWAWVPVAQVRDMRARVLSYGGHRHLRPMRRLGGCWLACVPCMRGHAPPRALPGVGWAPSLAHAARL
eukprot:15029249-Alexandrium_andersonii.AAC.1